VAQTKQLFKYQPHQLTMRAADLVVSHAKKRSPSDSVFRFVGWLSHQAANAAVGRLMDC